MTNHLFIQLILVISLWPSVSISASSQSINLSTTNAQKFIAEDEWLKLARQIFIEARSTYKSEPNIVIGQAKAGFIKDVLETIKGLDPVSQSHHLISLLRNATLLPKEQRDEITHKAIKSARENTYNTATHNLKSGELINIALYYSSQGDDNHSKKLFYEAVKEAEAGLSEAGGNSYRRITDRINQAPIEEIKPWMLEIIRTNFRKTKKARDLAYTCLDMAEIAWKINVLTQSRMYMKCASSAIKNIKDSKIRKRTIKKLERTEDVISYSNTSEAGSSISMAIRHARSGNINKSYKIVSKLKQNLYVDHKLTAYKRVFNDAIKRKDLKAAKYFAERPVRKLPYLTISIWTILAKKQLEMGDKKSALTSHKKASYAIDKIKISPIIYYSHIKSILQFSESMFQHGFEKEGRQSLLLAQRLLDKIAKKRLDIRIKASILVSEALWQNKLQNEAKILFKIAYEYTHLYDTNKRYRVMNKARFLSAIGQLAVTFGTKK